MAKQLRITSSTAAFLLASLVACGGGGGSSATAPAPQKGWGTAAPIESNNAGGVDSPQVAVSPNGDAVSVWAQGDGTRTNIWANRYTAGTGWGTALLIETRDEGDANAPQIAMNANGAAMATWTQSDGTYFNIWINRYTPGSGWGTAVQIESHTFGASSDPHIALDANGNGTAVWREDRLNGGGDTDIWTNRYTAGAGWGTAELLETDDTSSTDSPRIAFDGSGQATALWEQNNGSSTGIWAKHATASGSWGTAEVVKAWSGVYITPPTLAVDATGRAIASWSQSNGVTFHIQASQFTPGTGWSSQQTIDSDPGSAYGSAVAMDGSGNALAVWAQYDGTRNNIWACRLSSTTGWGTPGLIETDNAGYAGSAQISMDANGLAYTVWSQSDGTRNNIWSNRYQPTTGWETASLIETDNVGSADFPRVGMDASGHAHAVWKQWDGARYNALANRYN